MCLRLATHSSRTSSIPQLALMAESFSLVVTDPSNALKCQYISPFGSVHKQVIATGLLESSFSMTTRAFNAPTTVPLEPERSNRTNTAIDDGLGPEQNSTDMDSELISRSLTTCSRYDTLRWYKVCWSEPEFLELQLFHFNQDLESTSIL
ncbi:hypothetical protein L6452_09586 [Arctium lappa]|uniref:Uncharacterized protein n=1 Tax=Arctium lappa TaxID=4217 RepID=A0ACB9DKG9_ARCLA|nr:hypothetical protein L6452_09586 [Arctium lappa]